MKEQTELQFKVSIEDANILLNALSTQPFNQVAKLINNLQEQANTQLQPIKE
jgi:ribosome-associated toxin RatA of RatAB toxin-antitoxin module